MDALLASVFDMSDHSDPLPSHVSTSTSVLHDPPVTEPPPVKPPSPAPPSSLPSSSLTSCPPADPPPPHPATQSREDLLALARSHLLPAVVANAKRRDPSARQEVLEEQARKIITDEVCEQFIRKAELARTQLAHHENGLAAVMAEQEEHGVGEAAGIKRRAEDEHEGERSAKARRVNEQAAASPDAQPGISSLDTDAVGPAPPTQAAAMSSEHNVNENVNRPPGPPTSGAVPSTVWPHPAGQDVDTYTAAPHPTISFATENHAVEHPEMNHTPYSRAGEREAPPPQHPAEAQALPVPGIWFAKEGRAYADVVEIEFCVDPETAAAVRRWARRHDEFE